MSDASLRRVARIGLAPLVESVPEGPPWEDLTSDAVLGPAGQSKWPRPWLIGVASAIVVGAVFGAAALIGSAPSDPPTSSIDTPRSVFVPPTRIVGEETFLDLTLLDGSTITLAYPSDVDLTSKGLDAQTVGGVGAPNRSVDVFNISPEEFVTRREESGGPAVLTDTYTGPDGGVVERWEFSDIAYLVFDFEPWLAVVWDYKFAVREVAEGWAANLHGTLDEQGFLILDADPPLELVPAGEDPRPDGPDIRVEGDSGSLLVFIDDCDRMTLLDEEVYGREVFAFCDEPTNNLFFVGGTAEFQQTIHESLRVNPEEPQPTTTQPATTITTTTLAAQVPETGPVFGEESGVVLLFDDGLESVIAVDPDLRRAARSIVDGQRPGDEPYSMVRVGDKLIVGWNENYAVDIPSRESTHLGSATIFVPAVEPNSVWMIDYPGGRVGGGAPSVWRVTVDGEVVTETMTLRDGAIVIRGVAGGLAIQANSGIDIWDAATDTVSSLVGEGVGLVHHANEERFAWCSGQCDSMFLSDGIQFDSPPGSVFRSGAFSDDGRFFAAILVDHDDFSGSHLMVLDLDTGGSTSVSGVGSVDYIAWSPDSEHVFATGYSYGLSTTVIWRYGVSSGEIDSVVLPIGGGITPVVIDAVDADEYFGGSDSQSSCVSALGTLVITPEICNYDF